MLFMRSCIECLFLSLAVVWNSSVILTSKSSFKLKLQVLCLCIQYTLCKSSVTQFLVCVCMHTCTCVTACIVSMLQYSTWDCQFFFSHCWAQRHHFLYTSFGGTIQTFLFIYSCLWQLCYKLNLHTTCACHLFSAEPSVWWSWILHTARVLYSILRWCYISSVLW